MSTENGEYPTIGKRSGRTIEASSPDDDGEVKYDGPDSADALLQAAGMVEANLEDRILERLPEEADLFEDGSLRAESSRDDTDYDFLNQNRRAILQRLDDGMAPLDIVDGLGLSDSFVYRTRSVFNFLIEDSLLKEEFVDSGGKFAPTYDPQKEEEEETMGKLQQKDGEGEQEEMVPADEAREMAEEAYQNGLKEAGNDGSEPDEEPDTDLFSGDEWWDIMKTLMDNGEEVKARRIASEIDFD